MDTDMYGYVLYIYDRRLLPVVVVRHTIVFELLEDTRYVPNAVGDVSSVSRVCHMYRLSLRLSLTSVPSQIDLLDYCYKLKEGATVTGFALAQGAHQTASMPAICV